MTDQQLTDRYEVIVAAWKLMKEHGHIEDTDEYWEHLVTEGTKICRQHPGQFARDIIIAVCNELERLRGNKNDTH